MTYRCNGCGADLKVGATDEIVICDYCGASTRVREKQPVPTAHPQEASPPAEAQILKPVQVQRRKAHPLAAVLTVAGLSIAALAVFLIIQRGGGCSTFAEWYSPGCLVDANGDGVLDVAGWMGSPSDQNNLTVVDGIDGKTIWRKPGDQPAGTQVMCLGTGHVGIARKDFVAQVYDVENPDQPLSIRLTDEITQYSSTPTCAVFVTQDGERHERSLSDGSQTPCEAPPPSPLFRSPGMSQYSSYGTDGEWLDETGVRVRREEVPGLTHVQVDASSIALTVSGTTYAASMKASGTPTITVSASRDGAALWSTPLRYTAIGKRSVTLLVTPDMLVTYGTAPGSESGSLIGLDPRNGTVVYELDQKSTWSADAAGLHFNRKWVIVYWGFGLHAYDPATGERVWHIGGR